MNDTAVKVIALLILGVVAILCITLYAIIHLIVTQRGGSVNNTPGTPVMLVPVRSDQSSGSTVWEPFVINSGTHDHGEANQQLLADHVTEHHGPHSHDHEHDNLATNQEVNLLRLTVQSLQGDIRGIRQFNRNIRMRIASQYPYEVIGAIAGAIVGLIVAVLIPSKFYSFPTMTNVVVNGASSTVDYQLIPDHWVQGGIIVAGLLVGLVLGLAAKYLLGRNENVVEVQQ